jgi:hypothetical protein
MLEIQALIRILERKGLLTEDEVLDEVKVLKKEWRRRSGEWGERIK